MVKTIGNFQVDGKDIILRYPEKSDAKKLQKFINAAVKESLSQGGHLARTRPVSLSGEEIWVRDLIKKIENNKEVHVVAEYNKKIIGNADIRKESHDANAHIGVFGIVVLKEFTSKGLGTVLAEKIIKLAENKLKIEIVKLSVFENNKRAQGLYRKLGFEEIGRIKRGRKIKGKYADEILMVKYL